MVKKKKVHPLIIIGAIIILFLLAKNAGLMSFGRGMAGEPCSSNDDCHMAVCFNPYTCLEGICTQTIYFAPSLPLDCPSGHQAEWLKYPDCKWFCEDLEEICCKSGSYGSGMVEINVKYEQVFASECTPLGKGGFREIVDMSYCEEECDSDDDCPECYDCYDGVCRELIGCGTDEHGCIISAGYSWCEPKNKCIRSWEESCPEPGGISYYWHMYKWSIMMGIGVIFLLIILTRRRK